MGVGMNGNNSDSESCMKENRDQDHAMDGALDESQNERPSATGSGQFWDPTDATDLG